MKGYVCNGASKATRTQDDRHSHRTKMKNIYRLFIGYSHGVRILRINTETSKQEYSASSSGTLPGGCPLSQFPL